MDFFQGNDAKGYFVLGGLNYPDTGRFTGYETSEILAGFSDYEIGAASTYFKTFNWETGYFAQDDWKVNKRLTLNLGVRYDLYTNPYELAQQPVELRHCFGNAERWPASTGTRAAW